MTKHTYSLLPDAPDSRDYLFKAVLPPADLPESVDLREYCSPVEDQGQLGSCTANASIGLLEFLENKAGVQFFDLSRLFCYYNTRKLQNTIKYDSGASLRMTLKSLAKYGTCKESIWPYIEAKYRIKPTTQAYTDALNHQILQYLRLYNLNDFKACLASGFPFVCGIEVYSSFESSKVAQTGIIPMPKRSEQDLGGHAVLCIGYDDLMEYNDLTGYFIFKNSWGSGWGDSGYFYLPYDYLDEYGSDFWTVKILEGVNDS